MKRILTIAGSDSGGGAGIQADLKTIALLGAYGMSAVTALTAQNTVEVKAVFAVPLDFIAAQIDAVFGDIGVDAVKTGMLVSGEVVELVAARMAAYRPAVVVVDPVMLAKDGTPLLAREAREALVRLLLPQAGLVTPNLQEAAVLAGRPVDSEKAMYQVAEEIYDLGPVPVLLKGGHLQGQALDLLYDGKRFHEFRAARLQGRNTHGTGCIYAAAIATYMAQALSLGEAVAAAKRLVTGAIRYGLELGRGRGPADPYNALRHLDASQW